jgi:hypothetical protein
MNNRKDYTMDNNKNRMRDREKSNSELRKMKPKDNADVGMINGQVIGVHEGKHEKSRNNKK